MGKSIEERINGSVSISILANGEEIDCLSHINKVTITSDIHKLSSAEIAIWENEATEAEKEDKMLIGNEVEIRLGFDGETEPIFKGVLVKQSLTLTEDTSETCYTIKHPAYKMTLEKKVRSFENMTDSDIIKDICSEYGISADIGDSSVTHDKIVQYSCSDWDFVNLRAESCGLLLTTTTEGIKAQLPDVGSSPVVELKGGYSIFSIEAEIDGRYSYDSFVAKVWNYSSQEMEEVSIKGDKYDLEIGDLPASKLKTLSNNETINIPILANIENTDALSSLVESLVLRNNLSRIVGNIKTIGQKINPCDLIAISGIGKRYDGKTMVSSVVHDITAGKWETNLEIGFSNLPYCEMYDDIMSKPGYGTIAGVNGLQVAKVEALAGDPLGEERICVRLLNSDDSKMWVRVATLDAGKERGSFFMPEIDDEVIIGFIDANPNMGVVLGMLHSSSMPFPYEISDENNTKAFVTREKLTLEFDDEKKAICIITPNGNTISVSDDDKGLSLTDENGNTLTMNGDGVTIESKKNLSIKAAQDVTIEGANISINANSQLKAAGVASAELSSSGNAVLKGAMVQIN